MNTHILGALSSEEQTLIIDQNTLEF